MQSDTKKRVGILRGGSGKHYASSLKKGAELLTHIFENLPDKYKPVDILIDKDYIWHLGGVPVNPGDLMHKVDVVWNTSHPSFSNILESLSIPVVESSTHSFFDSNNDMLREHVKGIDLEMPRSIVLPVYQKDFDGPRERYAIKKAKEIFEKFGSPWIVKPASPAGGSLTPDLGMAMHVAKTFPELVNAIEDGVKHERSIIVEEFITGRVASVHSVPHFRGEDLYVFPIMGIFSGEKVPTPRGVGIPTESVGEKLENLARNLHSHIDAGHYLKSNFVLNPRGRIYLLSIESAPDLKEGSHFSLVCESVGAKMHHVVEHILERAFVL